MELEILNIKPGRDSQRRQHQAQVKNAIVAGETFSLVNLLAGLRTRQPYKNYTVPRDFEAFAFSIKGAVRLEMLNLEAYKPWRRLFGSNTRAKDISTWRSRVALQPFENLAAARAYVAADPLQGWSGTELPHLPDSDNREIEWLLLFQVRDVRLAETSGLFSDLLERYLDRDSKLFRLVSRWTVVPAAGGAP